MTGSWRRSARATPSGPASPWRSTCTSTASSSSPTTCRRSWRSERGRSPLLVTEEHDRLAPDLTSAELVQRVRDALEGEMLADKRPQGARRVHAGDRAAPPGHELIVDVEERAPGHADGGEGLEQPAGHP